MLGTVVNVRLDKLNDFQWIDKEHPFKITSCSDKTCMGVCGNATYTFRVVGSTIPGWIALRLVEISTFAPAPAAADPLSSIPREDLVKLVKLYETSDRKTSQQIRELTQQNQELQKDNAVAKNLADFRAAEIKVLQTQLDALVAENKKLQKKVPPTYQGADPSPVPLIMDCAASEIVLGKKLRLFGKTEVLEVTYLSYDKAGILRAFHAARSADDSMVFYFIIGQRTGEIKHVGHGVKA